MLHIQIIFQLLRTNFGALIKWKQNQTFYQIAITNCCGGIINLLGYALKIIPSFLNKCDACPSHIDMSQPETNKKVKKYYNNGTCCKHKPHNEIIPKWAIVLFLYLKSKDPGELQWRKFSYLKKI